MTSGNRAQRPRGWGQQHVLDQLDEGKTLSQICAEAADRGKLSPATLKDDIDHWRDRDQRFRDHVEDLMEKHHGTVRGRGSRIKLTDEKVEQFFELMEDHGGKVSAACDELGISTTLIYARLNPNTSLYDPAFAERFHVLEAARLAVHREKMMSLPERAEDAGDLKTEFQARRFILSTGMPHLHSEKHQLQITGSVDHNHRLPGLQEMARLTAHAAAAPDRKRLTADVVDAEVVGEG